MESIAQALQMMDDLGVEAGNFHQESHIIRDKLGYNRNSKIFTGYSTDTFDLDIIVEQFKKIQDSIEDEKENCHPKEKNIKLNEVELGKQTFFCLAT